MFYIILHLHYRKLSSPALLYANDKSVSLKIKFYAIFFYIATSISGGTPRHFVFLYIQFTQYSQGCTLGFVTVNMVHESSTGCVNNKKRSLLKHEYPKTRKSKLVGEHNQDTFLSSFPFPLRYFSALSCTSPRYCRFYWVSG